MDVRLPNGKILRGVPEGTSKQDIMQKAIGAKLAYAGDFLGGPIDIIGERKKAVGEFLTPIEKFAGGVRNTTSRAAGRINEFLGVGGEGSIFGPAPEETERNIREMSPGGGWETAGEITPIVAGGAGLGSGFVPQMAYGAASGGLTADDPKMGAALGASGAGLGTLAGRSIGRLGQGLRGNWADRAVQGADETSDSLRRLNDLGFKFTPGQASGKLGRQMADEVMATNVVLGSAHRSIAKYNTDLLTRYAAKAVGVSTDDIGPKALSAMDDAISQTFDDVARQVNNIPVPNITRTVADDLLPKRTLDDLGISSGVLSGRKYMNLRSELLSITRNAREQAKVKAAWDAIDELDNTVEQMAPQGFKAAYAAARERFKTLLTLEKFKRGVNSDGKINAKTVDSAAQDIFGKMYTRGQKSLLPETQDFLDALRGMASDRMTTNLGGSQTAARASLLGTTGLLGTAGWGLGGPLGAAGALGGAYGVSRAALAAPAPMAFGQVGGGLGRMTPYALEELNR